MQESNRDPRVFYLCRGENGKLVFPDELPDNYYSLGCWFIEEAETGQPADCYSFLAAHGKKYKKMTLVSGDTPGEFIVDAGALGKFVFHAAALDLDVRYGGQRQHVFKGTRLWELGPADQQEMERQEQACIPHDFYFLGAVGKPEEDGD
jgi:hypothetical protein